MKHSTILVTLTLLISVNVCAVTKPPHANKPTISQPNDSRDATREKMRTLLDSVGPKINVIFKRSDKQPYNFVGIMTAGLTNADSLEIVISVSAQDTIHFRIFPHYKGAYLNIDKVNNSIELMRSLLRLTDTSFFLWGVDESGDIFAGYNFTLESGFPEVPLTTLLRDIHNVDTFVRDIKPLFGV